MSSKLPARTRIHRSELTKSMPDISYIKGGEKVLAIVLADSFNVRFRPISLDLPRALLPLCNIPLIDYTLEFLQSAGIKDIYVYCCSHSQQISEHIQNSWRTFGGIRTIDGSMRGSRSAGDALRHLLEAFGDDIRHDFVLVGGDVISNMKLKGALEAHRRRKAEPRYVMTSIFKQASPSHRTRAGEDDSILAIDSSTSQLLFYENNRDKREIRVDRVKFLDHSSIQFRYDLLDCSVDICTPQVLDLYTEHFDWQHHRRDFLKSLMDSSLDITNTIYLEVIDDEYAARVRDLYTYGAVSRDVMRRWCYPFVPDNNFIGRTSFSYTRGNIYLETGVELARTCTIGPNSMIGSGSSVGGNSTISQSIVGRGCAIGRNVHIQNSYIWDGAVIEDDVKIEHALICTGVKISAGACIAAGSILSAKVVIPAGLSVPREAKLTTRTVEHHTKPFGAGDRLFLWGDGSMDNSDDDDAGSGAEDSSDPVAVSRRSGPAVNSLIYSPFLSESESDSDSEGGEMPGVPEAGNFERFHDELTAMTKTALQEAWKVDNALVQIKSFKFSVDKTFIDCAQVVVPVLFESLPQAVPAALLLKAFKQLVSNWHTLFKVFFPPDDQVELLLLIQDFCSSPEGKDLLKILPHALTYFYEEEIIEEEAFFEWECEIKSDDSPDAQLILIKAANFLTWLREASEDEDDSDDDSD